MGCACICEAITEVASRLGGDHDSVVNHVNESVVVVAALRVRSSLLRGRIQLQLN